MKNFCALNKNVADKTFVFQGMNIIFNVALALLKVGTNFILFLIILNL